MTQVNDQAVDAGRKAFAERIQCRHECHEELCYCEENARAVILAALPYMKAEDAALKKRAAALINDFSNGKENAFGWVRELKTAYDLLISDAAALPQPASAAETGGWQPIETAPVRVWMLTYRRGEEKATISFMRGFGDNIECSQKMDGQP